MQQLLVHLYGFNLLGYCLHLPAVTVSECVMLLEGAWLVFI
jgi:hypothetical protein